MEVKKIKLLLEYRCYPMWIYGDNGELLKNGLAEEFVANSEMDDSLKDIQKIYDGLFEDTETNFEYKGFANDYEKTIFLQKLDNVIELLKGSLGDGYVIENNVII